MSIFTDTQKTLLALEVARASRITLFGLHYDVNWKALRNKQMIIRSLIINDTWDVFTDAEVQCLQDKLTSPSSICITCH